MSAEACMWLAIAAMFVAPAAADAVSTWARAKYARPDAAPREDENA